jgi:hypothetical protein
MHNYINVNMGRKFKLRLSCLVLFDFHDLSRYKLHLNYLKSENKKCDDMKRFLRLKKQRNNVITRIEILRNAENINNCIYIYIYIFHNINRFLSLLVHK